MKRILIIILMLMFLGCEKNNQPESEPYFCIKVVKWSYPVGDYYMIKFRNSKTKIYNNIKYTYDLSKIDGKNHVVYDKELLNYNKAIALATKLDTYEKCISYNDSVKSRYEALKEYRKLHPIKYPRQTLIKCN